VEEYMFAAVRLDAESWEIFEETTFWRFDERFSMYTLVAVIPSSKALATCRDAMEAVVPVRLDTIAPVTESCSTPNEPMDAVLDDSVATLPVVATSEATCWEATLRSWMDAVVAIMDAMKPRSAVIPVTYSDTETVVVTVSLTTFNWWTVKCCILAVDDVNTSMEPVEECITPAVREEMCPLCTFAHAAVKEVMYAPLPVRLVITADWRFDEVASKESIWPDVAVSELTTALSSEREPTWAAEAVSEVTIAASREALAAVREAT
jgi:hypothetical protein